MMKSPKQGDQSVFLFLELAAVRLNIFIGNDPSCINDAIDAADAFLAAHPFDSNVDKKSAEWQAFAHHYEDLHAYNRGQMCAPPGGPKKF
jgi:hypothetical protein